MMDTQKPDEAQNYDWIEIDDMCIHLSEPLCLNIVPPVDALREELCAIIRQDRTVELATNHVNTVANSSKDSDHNSSSQTNSKDHQTEEIVWEISGHSLANSDSQDSAIFEFGGFKWRLSFEKKRSQTSHSSYTYDFFVIPMQNCDIILSCTFTISHYVKPMSKRVLRTLQFQSQSLQPQGVDGFIGSEIVSFIDTNRDILVLSVQLRG